MILITNDEQTITGGSILWIIFTFLSAVSFIFLGIWGLTEGNVRATTISAIFLFMIVCGILFSRGKIFSFAGSWRNSCTWFTVGFFLYLTIKYIARLGDPSANHAFSVISLGSNTLFASISDKLPQFWEFFTNAIGIPAGEELLWILAIPAVIISICNATKNKFLGDVWVQLILVIIISSTSFAIFHVGSSAIGLFVIAAIMFRTFLILIVWGEEKADILPFVQVAAIFALGCHMGNNWGTTGFFKGINILLLSEGGLKIFGFTIVALLGFIFLTAIDTIMLKLFKFSFVGGRA